MGDLRKLVAVACAGVALLTAAPAMALTAITYYTNGGIIVGYIIYGNDGHICAQAGTLSGVKGTMVVAQDC